MSLLALLAVSLLMPARRREVAGIAAVFRERRLRPWEASGAVLGACFVASQGLTAPMIGVALFSIAVTAGQACGALFVDHIGLSPSGRQAVSRSRVIATALAVTTMGVGASEQLTAGVAWATVLAAATPLATGAGLSVQQALNGRIARVVGPWAATVNNMVVGLATPIVAFAVSLLAAGSLNGMPGDADLYIGGLLGTAFVALTSWLARIHGVLVLGLSVIAGQVLAAGAIQHGHATPMSLIPVALTLTGVLIALRQRAHH
ncbi:transporter family-2 protein [Streptomyces achromogenes]|nr:transporter family-2 protein [Streptomyces achromogenes]